MVKNVLTKKKRSLILPISIFLFLLVIIGVVGYSFGNSDTSNDPPIEETYLVTATNLPIPDKIEETEPGQAEIEEEAEEIIEEVDEPEVALESETRPMTEERQDNSYGPEIGQIIIESVGLELVILQGAGSSQQSSFQRLFYAVADKVDAELGTDNFILASHSVSTNVNAGFSPLLLYQDGSFNPYRDLDVDQLELQIGDSITIFLEDTQRYYIFEVSIIEGDVSPEFSRLVDLLADIEDRPQLTLYSCSAVDGDPDGRIVVQAEFISNLYED